MENNLSLVGFVANYTGLQQADAAQGGKYAISEFELHTDEATVQSPVFRLTGSLAVQLDTCAITPQTQLRVHFRVFSREYDDKNGIRRRGNDLNCWKVEVLDANLNVVFVCRK